MAYNRASWEKVFLLVLSFASAAMLAVNLPEHPIIMSFFIIPIILGANYYGLPGGLCIAAGCAGLMAAIAYTGGEGVNDSLVIPQIILYLLVGGFGGFMRSEQMRIQDALHRSSITDELTGLYNYQHFRTRLDEEVKRAKRYGHPLALVMCDINKFKSFNDTYGHPNGNFVLNKIGCLIRESIRESDIPFRYGGDEFAVILPETAAEAKKVAERVIEAVASAFARQYDNEGPRPSLSAGVAYRDSDVPLSAPLLISFADQALYKAKQAGTSVETCSMGERVSGQ